MWLYKIFIILFLKFNHFAPTVKIGGLEIRGGRQNIKICVDAVSHLHSYFLCFPERCNDVHSGCAKGRKHASGKAHDK